MCIVGCLQTSNRDTDSPLLKKIDQSMNFAIYSTELRVCNLFNNSLYFLFVVGE